MAIVINPSKGKIDFDKKILKISATALNEMREVGKKTVIKNIKDTIAIGNSPVKNYGRFVKYSTSYSNSILKGKYKLIAPDKGVRPVNLYLTGKMMNSLISRDTKNGFSVYFTNKLAKIHSELGAGKSKVIRKIMPSGNEVFKDSITFELSKTIRDFLKNRLIKLFR